LINSSIKNGRSEHDLSAPAVHVRVVAGQRELFVRLFEEHFRGGASAFRLIGVECQFGDHESPVVDLEAIAFDASNFNDAVP
jgi:hypothetical protein